VRLRYVLLALLVVAGAVAAFAYERFNAGSMRRSRSTHRR